MDLAKRTSLQNGYRVIPINIISAGPATFSYTYNEQPKTPRWIRMWIPPNIQQETAIDPFCLEKVLKEIEIPYSKSVYRRTKVRYSVRRNIKEPMARYFPSIGTMDF